MLSFTVPVGILCSLVFPPLSHAQNSSSVATQNSSSSLADAGGPFEQPYIGASSGIKPLTAADIAAINELVNGDANVTETDASLEARTLSAPNLYTAKKWAEMQMDDWLEKYLQNVTIWKSDEEDTGVPLIQSTNFLSDFWTSSGEEGDPTACQSILQSCTVSTSETYRTGLSPEDGLRARFVREAIRRWFDSTKQGYTLMQNAVLGSALDIGMIQTTFKAVEQPKPADPMSILLPLLSTVAIFVPALAPAVAVIGAVSAAAELAKTNKRDVDSILDSAASAPQLEVRQGKNEEEIITRARSNAVDQTNYAIKQLERGPNSIKARLEAIETKVFAPKPLSDTVKGFGDSAQKVITNVGMVMKGVKALSPGLKVEQVDGWVTWNSRAQMVLQKFVDSISDSFEANTKTWLPATIPKPGKSSGTVTNAGMRDFLFEGAALQNQVISISSAQSALKIFFKKLILNEILKTQSVYLWRQHFPNEDECKKWIKDYVDQSLLPTGSTPCVKKGSEYQIRIARKPYSHDPLSKRRKRQWGGYIAQGNAYMTSTAVRVAPTAAPDNKVRFIRYPWVENSAFYDKWTDANFKLIDIGDGVTADSIFAAAEACQDRGGDPFKNGSPTRDDLYKAPYLDKFDPNNPSDALCLISLPVLDINDGELAEWCKNNLGLTEWKGYLPGYSPSSWNQGVGKCVDFMSWAMLGDTKVCQSQIGDTISSSVPGCDLHNRAVQVAL